MNILITGANGFLGKIVAKKLTDNGHKITAIVLPEEDTTYLATLKNVNVIRGNLNNIENIKHHADKIDIIIHLAALLNSSDRELNMKINYEATKNIADLAEKNNIKKVIFTSSMTATSKNPNAYGESKKLAEEYLSKKTFRTIIIRPTLLYGKGGAAFMKLVGMLNMLPAIVPIIGKGNSIKQPIYVHDAAEIIKRAAETDFKENKIYQIGGPEQIEFKKYGKKILEAQGKNKIFVHAPRSIVWLMLGFAEKLLKNLPVTREAILELETNTQVDYKIIEKDFKIKLTDLEKGIKESL